MGFSFQNADYFRLAGKFSRPSVTLYIPMESSPPELRQNPVRFRNAVKAAEIALASRYPKEADYFVETLREIDVPAFWQGGAYKGLAVFLSHDLFEVHKLPFEVSELVLVSESFHTRPLLKYVVTTASYYVLAVSQDHVAFFDGWRERLKLIETPQLPQQMKEVVGEYEKDSQCHHHSAARGGGRAVYHTPGKDARDSDRDLEVFFKAVDSEIRRLLKRSRRPVILTAQPHNEAIYRRVTRLPWLIPKGISCEAKGLSLAELGERAWALVEEWTHARLSRFLESFHKAKSRAQGSDELLDVARKAAQGRVKLLLLGSEAPVWGRLDRATGEIEIGEDVSGAADVLDELAELVLERGGDVRIWEGVPFPVTSGVAAVYSYS